MTIQTQKDLEGLRRVGRIVKSALRAMEGKLNVGVSTQELDDACAEYFERSGACSAPRLSYGFPGAACISINEETVHGIPQANRVIQAGDLVKLDVSAELDGYFADAAITIAVAGASRVNRRLAGCARTALYRAIAVARAGQPMHVIGSTVQAEVERQGFNIIPMLGGHGIGKSLHEAPFVPNYYAASDNEPLHVGLVLAVEPVISAGSGESIDASDGWTMKTADGAASAHWEHTVVIGMGHPLVVTA